MALQRYAMVPEDPSRRSLGRWDPDRSLLGESPGLREVRRLIHRYAPSDQPVLVTGEPGTGKELAARAIHACSEREGRLAAENCGAIPEHLAESVLFGHAKGAFTGAVEARTGLFSTAAEGTLFLDEVGELPAVVQAKLLRALDPGEFSPVGSTEVHSSAARVIAATNRVEALDRESVLRPDLLSRLDVLRIHLPPLRERAEDIPLLAHWFVPETEITPDAMDLLAAHPFQGGNVRELRNAVTRAALLSAGGPIRPEHVLEALGPPSRSEANHGVGRSLRLEDAKRTHVLRVLDLHDGNVSAAGRALDVDRGTLRRWLRDWGVRAQAWENTGNGTGRGGP